MTAEPFDDGTSFMAVCAFRYCMGRRSYAVGLCIDWLKANWGRLRGGDRAVVVADLEQEFAREAPYRCLGDPAVDEPRWRGFLAWAKAQTPAKEE